MLNSLPTKHVSDFSYLFPKNSKAGTNLNYYTSSEVGELAL